MLDEMIKTDVRIKVGEALIELDKDSPDMDVVRAHLNDAVLITFPKQEDGSLTYFNGEGHMVLDLTDVKE